MFWREAFRSDSEAGHDLFTNDHEPMRLTLEERRGTRGDDFRLVSLCVLGVKLG